MAIIREFNLHTNAGPSIPPVIHVNQYDRGETWKFKLYQPNGQQLTPTDAAIVGIKSDGHIIANAGTVSAGVISITETEQMTAAPGKAVFEILFDNDTHGTANFIVLVEPSPTNDGVASESDLSLFQEAIDSISPATINAAVSAWMSAQLTPSEWVIDNSLTVANAAADAKAAGDLIRQNTSDIGDLTELVTEDQSSLVGAINETRTDLYNWFTDDIEKVKYIYDGSAQDADIYEVKRLEWAAADDADITGMKVITRKEGTSTDTSKFFVDGNELMEYVIGDMQGLTGTVTEELSDLKSAIQLLSSIPTAVKRAMDTLFQNVAFKNDDVYTDELATFHAWATSVNLISISAVYTQSGTVTNRDSLNSLKDGLVVTATYDDSTTATIRNYTLSGELTSGVCPVTVSYEGKTATFTVNVTAVSVPSAYTEYDYMYVTSEQYTKAAGTWMRLKKYANLNAVSCEFKFKSLPEHYAGGALFGHRSASGGTSSFAFYSGDAVVGYHLHGADAGAISGYIPAATNEIHTVKYRNTAQSPSSLSVDDTTIAINWVNNNTLNLDPVMFSNPINEGSINIIAFNQVGDMKFYDLEGTLINYYVPVIRASDNVIGMYDMVEDTFYTPTTASVATVGNSGCFYAVGNWS